MKKTLSASTAFHFVLVIGVVNLFADMTYEGARSSTGQFLGTLGASAAVVGFTAGLGELVGYALRSVSGVISDKTGKYWIVTIVGYCINMLAVPALALAGQWPVAAGLIVAERTGRAKTHPGKAPGIEHRLRLPRIPELHVPIVTDADVAADDGVGRQHRLAIGDHTLGPHR